MQHSTEYPEALSLAQLFSTCVECFGLIHPGKEWDHEQRVLIAKLGIQQGRLLAWGDMIGITELGPARDPRLQDTEMRGSIEQALQSIIDRPAHLARTQQFEIYGLKPPKHFISSYQPALDTARLESFRAKLEMLQEQRWEVRRGMSIIISHWIIADPIKFKGYLDMIKAKVDFLIGLMDNESRVDRALALDIKALGWHPIFDKARASADMSKLRLIKEASQDEYPSYAVATGGALDYLDKEWKDSYQEAMERGTYDTGTEIPGAAARLIAQARRAKQANDQQPTKRPGLFGRLRPKSWRKGSKTNIQVPSADEQEKGRSQSLAFPSEPLTPPMSPDRSKSIAVFVAQGKPSEDDSLSRTETAKSLDEQKNLEPIQSMISRHDYWRNSN
jgi:hypothetical protein